MSELLLDSLEIKGYRCFEHLTINKLDRINLIVGKNSVGKTAFLEAVWIYANENGHHTIEKILVSRREDVSYQIHGRNSGSRYRHLFFNRDISDEEIKIGSFSNSRNYVTVDFSAGNIRIASPKPLQSLDPPHLETNGDKKFKITNFFVGISGLNDLDVDVLWEKVELTPLEDKILESLKLILPMIVKVRPRLVESQAINSRKVVYVQSADNDEPLPLKSFGEGLNHLFEIALVLVSCKDGILLIDEIENGLHYSILPDVWKVIFHIAKELNVQVFVTTHSKDCIEAFTSASVESPEEGMLIRLERHDERIVAKAITEERLAEAVDYEVEVR